MTTETLNEIIAHRRSIFPAQYSGETIPEEYIQQMLEAANWAPNHKLTEPWRFVVFTGKGLEALGREQAAFYKQVSQAKGTYAEAVEEKLRTKPTTASHVIAIGMARSAKVPEVEEVMAVASAVQNMQLVAHSLGVGCYWGTGGITWLPGAEKLFGWTGEGDRLLGFLYCGVPRADLDMPTGRRSAIGDKVAWVDQ